MATNLHGQDIPDWEVYCGKCGYTYPLNTAGPTQVCPQCRHYTMFRRDLPPKEETKQMPITYNSPQVCDQCHEATLVKTTDCYDYPIWQCSACTAQYDGEDWTYLGKAKDKNPDVQVQIKLEPNGKLPAKAHATDACYDCYANEDLTLYPGKAYAVSLGFALAIPEGWVANILPRSGLSLKGLRVLNSPGKVDADFRGVVKALLKWEGLGYMDVHAGDRLVQMEFQRVPLVQLLQVDELDNTERGEGGFGSTGVK